MPRPIDVKGAAHTRRTRRRGGRERGRKVKVFRPSERRSAPPIAASAGDEAEREVTDAWLRPSLADVGVVKRKKETCLVAGINPIANAAQGSDCIWVRTLTFGAIWENTPP